MRSSDDFERGLSRHFLRGLDDGTDNPVAARWALLPEITSDNWRFGSQPGMMFLGYRRGVTVGRRDDRHQVTIGGSRTGKGVSLINPVLLTMESSCICTDPKGELARLTAPARERRLGQRCIVLDPFATSGRPSHRFNPLLEIREHVPEKPGERWPHAIDDALALADALIVQSTSEAHWSDSAKTLLQALILMVLPLPEDERNLATVRDFLMLKDPSLVALAEGHGGDKEKALFAFMASEVDIFGGVVAGIGEQFLSMGDRERGSILSTARTQTQFLDSPALRATLTESDFQMADLKLTAMTIYLCLPASNMATHDKWLRMIITLALRECERVAAKPELPVLFVLDEFAVLGHMRVIESAAGQMAGFGVKLWVVVQDLGQLKNAYKGTWETFFGNAAVLTFHGVSDMTTLEYLSKRLGTRSFTVPVATGAGFAAVSQGAALSHENMQSQPLAAPHELAIALARERESLIVIYPGAHPMILQRTIAHEDPFFTELL